MKFIAQFILVCSTMIMLLVGIELAQGNTLAEALPFAIGWGLLSSAIFIGSRYFRQSRNKAGAVRPDKTEPH